MLLLIFEWLFPFQANAEKENPLIFVVDPNLQKPLIVYGPYAKIPQKVNRMVPPKTPSKKADKQPVPEDRRSGILQSQTNNYGQGEIQDLIRKYSEQFGIDPTTPLCIAKKESGFNPQARNKSSSASGVFQYLSGTWESTDEGKLGLSVFNAENNIRAAIKYLAIHKSTQPWISTAKNCPPLSFL